MLHKMKIKQIWSLQKHKTVNYANYYHKCVMKTGLTKRNFVL